MRTKLGPYHIENETYPYSIHKVVCHHCVELNVSLLFLKRDIWYPENMRGSLPTAGCLYKGYSSAWKQYWNECFDWLIDSLLFEYGNFISYITSLHESRIETEVNTVQLH